MDSLVAFPDQYLANVLLLLLLISSGLAFILGLGFLLLPAQTYILTTWLNRWYSLRSSIKPLESTRSFDPTLYRHHRGIGLFIIFGASYVLYQLGFNYHHHILVMNLTKYFNSSDVTDWLLTALMWFSVPAMLLILLFGATLATRPSRLKGIEQRSNRWISTRRWLLLWEAPHSQLDNFVQRHPRSFGLLVTVLSAYSLIILFVFFFSKTT